MRTRETILYDASALLAYIFGENGKEKVYHALKNESGYITTVNLSETATKMLREGFTEKEMRATLPNLGLQIIDIDEGMSYDAAILDAQTRQYGLSLGDRLCLVAARRWGYTVYTADTIWKKLSLDIKMEFIR